MQKNSPLFLPAQEHLRTCGFNISIVFVKCQERVQRCTRCTACIMKFKKHSSRKGQNTKCALNCWGLEHRRRADRVRCETEIIVKLFRFCISPAVLFLPITSAFMSRTRKALEHCAGVNQCIRKGLGGTCTVQRPTGTAEHVILY